jgi:uncharacterized membrane protein
MDLRLGDSCAAQLMADAAKPERFAYIDWMRGFACLLMFEVHGYDSWLTDSLRETQFYRWSQFSGTIAAPIFLFLAGASLALVSDRMKQKGATPNQVERRLAWRGVEIVGLGYLLRLQEFVMGYRTASWTDLLRVDILNTIGVSLILMALLWRACKDRRTTAIASLAICAAIVLATPALWTTMRPRWLPWFLESYINGVHTYDVPQVWLFPIFPWTAFAFAGLALGCFLFDDWATKHVAKTIGLLGILGAVLFFISIGVDKLPLRFFAPYDYWHTGPAFFLARVGVLLIFFPLSYAWCRWGLGAAKFRPTVWLGQTSLLVYWVHIVFVYGHFSIMRKHEQTIAGATWGIFVITAAMVLLAVLRLRWKGHGAEILAKVRSSAVFGHRQ